MTISQPVLHIEPTYLCLHPCFGGQRIHWNNFLMTRNMPNVKWRPFWEMAAIQNYIWPLPFNGLYLTSHSNMGVDTNMKALCAQWDMVKLMFEWLVEYSSEWRPFSKMAAFYIGHISRKIVSVESLTPQNIVDTNFLCAMAEIYGQCKVYGESNFVLNGDHFPKWPPFYIGHISSH